MKLYFSPGACSLSPHIALREAGIPFELVRVDLRRGVLAADGSDFRRINPNGYVPVLELDDGRRLLEGPAIVQYIADLRPEAGLAPPNGTFERYQLQSWLGYINSEIHKSFSPLFRADTPEDYKPVTRRNLSDRLAVIVGHLADHDYLMGEQFTVADAYLFVTLGWCGFAGIDIGQWPSLSAFRERVGQRPPVQAALAAEGTVG
jgi:glutathione S-transferase